MQTSIYFWSDRTSGAAAELVNFMVFLTFTAEIFHLGPGRWPKVFSAAHNEKELTPRHFFSGHPDFRRGRVILDVPGGSSRSFRPKGS